MHAEKLPLFTAAVLLVGAQFAGQPRLLQSLADLSRDFDNGLSAFGVQSAEMFSLSGCARRYALIQVASLRTPLSKSSA